MCRRAKIKNIAKKSIESGEDCNDIPESMRRYLALQALESGKPLGRDLLGRCGSGSTPYGGGAMLFNADSSSNKVGQYLCAYSPMKKPKTADDSNTVIHHFACRSLSIGSWRRVGQSAMDLVIFYSPDKACVTYYINNDSAGYKIEYPFSHIRNISLDTGDGVTNAEGASQRPGGLIVELNRPPNFFMDDSGSGGFLQCGDFTEEHQASRVLVHHLGGYPKVLSGQLAKLVSLESFQNRFNHFDPNALAVSAPVSPINHRPASQPNHMAHPHINVFQDSAFGPSLHPPRGHKRQRSRSVPVAVDLSMLRNPMPSFLIQHEHPQHHMSQPDIYSPIPQHHQAFGPVAPNLSIDTSANFTFDLRQYPMSATTANSPSEYGTPAFFAAGPPSDSGPPFTSSYSLPYLSPMVDPAGMMNHSASPLSALSPGDPVIANQSPPLAALDRSASADLYPMSHDNHGNQEDALSLSEMYSKSLALPFRNSIPEEHSPADIDLQGLVNYGTIDPASLRPDQSVWHEQKIKT